MGQQDQELRVLVIDDDCAVADTLALVLRSAGYRALPSYSASEAREAFRLFHPQLVLCDVTLGDGNGMELAAGFQQARRDCRILLFSGAVTAKELRQLALQDHKDDFVARPIAPQRVVELISNMFEAVAGAAA